MMLEPDVEPSDDDFEGALGNALAGLTLTDQGFDQAVSEALEAVALEPFGERVEAARRAWRTRRAVS